MCSFIDILVLKKQFAFIPYKSRTPTKISTECMWRKELNTKMHYTKIYLFCDSNFLKYDATHVSQICIQDEAIK